MDQRQLFDEIVEAYSKHGWCLARVLMKRETLLHISAAISSAECGPVVLNPEGNHSNTRAIDTPESSGNARKEDNPASLGGVPVRESSFDAMWFTRPAQGGREAWELRALSPNPYALLELFEPGELEDDREDVRREMEMRLAER